MVGNCQAGWAIMMLAAAAPDLVGLVSITGSPLSYWAGVEGKNPMRYAGGLNGGSWLASLAGDLGNGKFDGAHLVDNFENLNPANTLWTKQYNLYSKIDTEERRYLDFEKWWSGYFFMTKEEIRSIVDELFVGNKLTKGTILTKDRRAIDLRNIKAPIVVIASWGDNITPPQQALFWIPDLYENVAEIVANEQTIIYTLDERIGHLGIFVSAKVAEKQHAELVNTMDLIEVLPPGLYEMVIEDKTPADVGADLLPGQYLVRFEARTVEDILKLGDGREHEQAFETVARISEINEGLYDTLPQPLGQDVDQRGERRGAADDAPAPAAAVPVLRSQPGDVAAPGAGRDGAQGPPAGRRRQRAREGRARGLGADRAGARPLPRGPRSHAGAHLQDDLQLADGRGAGRPAGAARRRPQAARPQRGPGEAARGQDRRDPRPRGAGRLRRGGDPDHAGRRQGAADDRRPRLPPRPAASSRASAAQGPEPGAAEGDRQGRGVHDPFDEEHALASLPALLPSEADRREALEIVRQVGRARGELGAEGEALLDRIERILGLEPAAAGGAPRRRRGQEAVGRRRLAHCR